MITQFRLENFEGHRDTDLALQQFTVLVGDNGSGKTSVLDALRLPGQLSTPAEALGLDEVLRQGADHMKLSLEGSTSGQRWSTSFTVGLAEPAEIWGTIVNGVDAQGEFHDSGLVGDQQIDDVLHRSMGLMRRVALYRFRSDQVAATAYSNRPEVSVAEDGEQTAVVLAARQPRHARRPRLAHRALRS